MSEGTVSDESEVGQGPAPFITGVGASAGGLEALTQLFEAAPPHTGMAFVVVQHLSPDYKSMVADLLAGHTALSVRRARDGLEIEAETIYVIEPGTVLRVSDGKLQVERSHERMQHPINALFSSLAASCGANAACIVLSGTGTDGAKGLVTVKEHGGVTLVQSPETAGFDGMPAAAVATGCADLVLPPSRLLSELARLRSEGPAEYFGASADGAEVVLTRILAVMRVQTGIDFGYYKPAMLARRVERRIAHLGIDDPREYVRRLKDDEEEARALQSDLLIGVTRFLRDTGAIDAVREHAIPRLVGRAGPRPLRLWVAACSTGEEAYSMAMLLTEGLAQANMQNEFKIFATDIDQRALEAAGRGEFDEESLQALPESWRARYFEKSGDRYVVVKSLRERLLFSRHNVITDPPFSRVDMVTCRNMLIYLKPPQQTRVLKLFNNSLLDGGLLWLGSSEVLGDLSEYFEVLDSKWKLFSARHGRPRQVVVPVRGERRPAAAPDRRPAPEFSEAAEQLLTGYLPPTIIVDPAFGYRYRYGNLHGLLRFPTGMASNDLRDLLPPRLAALVSTACQHTLNLQEEAFYQDVQLPPVEGETPVRFDLRTRPIKGREGPLVAIIFEGLEINEGEPEVKSSLELSEAATDRIAELELELRHSRENLQATVEELESSNEELQATNEELVASNEELQSTNEELQSVNEELYTVNSEFSSKVEELTAITEDLDSLLASLEVGVLFLDSRLAIRRFNQRAAHWVNVMPQDMGRPLAHLTHGLDYPQLLDDCARVIRTGEPFGVRCRAKQCELLVSMTPMRSQSGTIRGMVMAVTDISDVVRSTTDLAQAKGALEHSDMPVCTLDAEGKITLANPAFIKLSGRDPNWIRESSLLNLCAAEDRENIERALKQALGGQVWSGSTTTERPDGSRFRERIHLIPTRAEGGDVVGVVRVSEPGQLHDERSSMDAPVS